MAAAQGIGRGRALIWQMDAGPVLDSARVVVETVRYVDPLYRAERLIPNTPHTPRKYNCELSAL